MRAIGRIVRAALDRTAAAVRPGITTAELDAIGARVLAEHGAESAPPKVYGFPGALCISVNEEAIHGIPGDRVDPRRRSREARPRGGEGRLLRGCRGDGHRRRGRRHRARAGALRRERASGRGRAPPRRAIASSTSAARWSGRPAAAASTVMRELCGHGVGRTIHEAPSVPNYHDRALPPAPHRRAGHHDRADHRGRQRKGVLATTAGPSTPRTAASPHTTSTRW